MTTVLLIRHGMTDAVGKRLVGRLAGFSLNEQGRREVEALSERLRDVRLSAIYASPLERTQETARAIAAPHGLEVQTREGLIEVDFGDWTGKLLPELADDPRWQHWNSAGRMFTPIPGGEHVVEIQRRMVAEVLRVRDIHPDQIVALVSHGDPVRSALCAFAGIPLDLLQRIDISTASVSVIRLTPSGVCVVRLNDTGPLSSTG
jgi:probable phosphoglycerate mutase